MMKKSWSWKSSLGLIGLLAGLALALSATARAQGVQHEKSEDFQKSKVKFGQDHLGLTAAAEQDQEGKEEKAEKDEKTGPRHREHARHGPAKKPAHPAPDWLKGKTVGGWGGPTVNYLNLNLDIFDPLTERRGLDGFHNDLWPVGGWGVGRIGPLRIGGMGMGLEQRESHNLKKATMSLGLGGGVLEVEGDVHPKVGLIGGAMLGGGAIHLTAKGPDVTGGSWSEDETFFVAYPYAGLSVKVVDFMRLEANYGWMFFDYSPGGHDYEFAPGKGALDGSLKGGGSAQVRLIFGYDYKVK